MRKISQHFDECDRNHCGHKVVVLLGMGGQGKSSLALGYGQKSLNNDDPKMVLWMDATSVETLSSSFEDVADRWNNRKRRFADSGLRIDSVNAKLAGSASRLILYNYDYPNHFPYICSYIPPTVTRV